MAAGHSPATARAPALKPQARTKVQPKLTVSTPGDKYEQEADLVAEKVMSRPEPELQRAGACGGGCPKCLSHGEPTQRMIDPIPLNS
jgi:hypothetical protein